MAGRITKAEQQLVPDPRYGSKQLSRFINCIMLEGKKSVAQRVVYNALDDIKKRLEQETDPNAPKEPLAVFERAISNVKPRLEVRSKRVGGANYQVPMQVTSQRRMSLCFRWIITSARAESGKPMAQRLARELYDAARGEGKAMNTREQTHRMAEANRAFAHFAW